jgi:hypothetical protein
MTYQLASAYGVPQWGQILTAASKKAFFCFMCRERKIFDNRTQMNADNQDF